MKPDPTLFEIANACQEIQLGWDEQEFERRAGMTETRLSRWIPPGPLKTFLHDRDMQCMKTNGLWD